MDALHATGLLRYLQPKVWGGMELPFVAYFDIPEMLARGDISIALGGRQSRLATTAASRGGSRKAQEEVWGENPDAGIASGIAYQQGRGVPVDGGLVLSGEWNFSSGTRPFGLEPARVHRARRRQAGRLRVLPAAPVAVRGDRRLARARHARDEQQDGALQGRLRSRASRRVDVSPEAGRASWPGLEVHRNPHYRIPISALGGNGIGGLPRRQRAQRAARDDRVGEVAQHELHRREDARFPDGAAARVARPARRSTWRPLLVRNDCIEAERTIVAGGTLDFETRLRYKRNTAMAAKLAVEAVDSLHEMAGANGIYDRYPLQRMFRDARAAAGHFSFSVDAQLPPWGLVALGGEVKSPTL